MSTFEYAPLYIGPKKVGEIETLRMTFMSNGEQIIDVDEVAESTGVVTCEGTFDTVIPKGGMTVDMLGAVLKQKDIEVGLLIAGGYYKVKGRLNKCEVSSTVKSGVTKGNFNFRGGTPKKAA